MQMSAKRGLAALWALLTLLNLISLLGYRSAAPVIWGFSARYLLFVLLYVLSVIGCGFLWTEQGDRDRRTQACAIAATGFLTLLQAIWLLGFHGHLPLNVAFPWAFPAQWVFAVLVVAYAQSRAFLAQAVMAATATCVALKIVDVALGVAVRKAEYSFMPGLELHSAKKTLRTLDLYPYEGFHTQANFSHRGPLPGERSPELDYAIDSGSMGFFVDFDLLNPPKKQPGEYRVILIGGSGAQGWGGTRNDTMLYARLEQEINARLKGRAERVRVINLAMAGFNTYQNYIALNRYAHPLEPDLILSYSGINDHGHLLGTMSDASYMFQQLNALVLACRASEFPPGMKWAQSILPNLLSYTNLGLALKMGLSHRYFNERAVQDYRSNHGFRDSSGPEFLDEVVIPFYVHAVKSIKRDFAGIPIIIAWQAAAKIRDEKLGEGYYNRMFVKVRHELKGYLNDKWRFVNVHKAFENDASGSIDVHLSDDGHARVAQLLAPTIVELLPLKRPAFVRPPGGVSGSSVAASDLLPPLIKDPGRIKKQPAREARAEQQPAGFR